MARAAAPSSLALFLAERRTGLGNLLLGDATCAAFCSIRADRFDIGVVVELRGSKGGPKGSSEFEERPTFVSLPRADKVRQIYVTPPPCGVSPPTIW